MNMLMQTGYLILRRRNPKIWLRMLENQIQSLQLTTHYKYEICAEFLSNFSLLWEFLFHMISMYVLDSIPNVCLLIESRFFISNPQIALSVQEQQKAMIRHNAEIAKVCLSLLISRRKIFYICHKKKEKFCYLISRIFLIIIIRKRNVF